MTISWQIPCDAFVGWWFNAASGLPLFWSEQALLAVGPARLAGILRRSFAVFPQGVAPEDSFEFATYARDLCHEGKAFQHRLFEACLDSVEDVPGLSHQWLMAVMALWREAKN